MTFRRGATLPVSVTLGHADTCDLGPTAGNGFYKRWPDDLALLADLGVTDLRLTFDWARFQPKPGEFSGAWVERYENVVQAATAVGMTVWAALHDAGVPRWFVNEGGLDDDEAVTAWWPRWVERVADRFGDAVEGWIPFAELPNGLPDQVWIDTWGILGGGDADVVLSLTAADGFGAATRHEGRFGRLGIAFDALADPDVSVDAFGDDLLDGESNRWTEAVHSAAEAVSGAPIVVSRFTPNHDDPDVDGRLMDRMVGVLDAAIADGITVDTCFVEPAIAGPDSAMALLGTDRTPRPAAEVYLTSADDDR